MISAVSRSATSDLSSSRICAWIVTSSAVVGSSAIRSFGSPASGHRDHRPLPHPAGELVRIVLQAHLRARDPDLVEQLGRAPVGLVAVHREVGLERLADLPADRQHRVQRRHRILEDHRDLAAADRAQLLVVSDSRSRPPNIAVPFVTRPLRARIPSSASEVTLLPQPDSPTIPSVSPGAMSNEIPLTA